MVEKLSIKSSRVKSIAFHPKRPWVIAGLYNGAIHIWDYQIELLLSKYNDCEGPIRCVSFHHEQPLFVSGGDDYKIRVWNYHLKRVLFELTGHMDYIRTTFFHRECPWILSASDDQTIKIWNWQSRQCISTIPGHSHYVMCAQFHPVDSLVVSCSLDQTVRLWDISRFIQRYISPSAIQKELVHSQLSPLKPLSQLDIISSLDILCIAVLDGHSRGVNWVSFHPTQKLIVSASDDKQVKLWRYSENSAWEIDTCRGHMHNVSSADFIPKINAILSVSEDKSFRLWDDKKRIAFHTQRSENDRFWCSSVHPNRNLYACGHDSGMTIYKIHRERPACDYSDEDIIYIKENTLRRFNVSESKDVPICNLKRSPANFISYNNSKKLLLISHDDSFDQTNQVVELYILKGDMNSIPKSTKYSSKFAVWISNDRFAALSREQKVIILDSTANEVLKLTQCSGVRKIFTSYVSSQIICAQLENVYIFDLETKEGVRYAVWSANKLHVALLAKKCIKKCGVREIFNIKSGAWLDESESPGKIELIYITTLRDSGIIRTIEEPIYIYKIKNNKIFAFDRNTMPKILMMDDLEINFKLALINHKYDQVIHLMRTSELVGQSLISFLQKKGYAEIAMHYIKDKDAQFDLAIQCCNMDIAFEAAKSINREPEWNKLGKIARFLGYFKVAEFCHSTINSFDELLLFYISSGNMMMIEKLQKTEKLAMVFENLYMDGNNDLTKNGIKLPVLDDPYVSPKLTPRTAWKDDTWPMLNIGKSIFDFIIPSKPTFESESRGIHNSDIFQKDTTLDDITENTVEGVGWDIDTDVQLTTQLEYDDNENNKKFIFDIQKEEMKEESAWNVDDLEIPSELDEDEEKMDFKNRPVATLEKSIPASHVYWKEGSTDSLIKCLCLGDMSKFKQILLSKGIKNIEPLKDLIYEIRSQANLLISSPLSSSPLKIYPPLISKTLEDMQNLLQCTTSGKFQEAEELFRKIIHISLFTEQLNKGQLEQLSKIILICKEYIIGMKTELLRRKLMETAVVDRKRICELALYFCHMNMQPNHLILALRSALSVLFKFKIYGYCSQIAKQLIQMAPPSEVIAQAKKVLNLCEKNNENAFDVDYDPQIKFEVCGKTCTPIYQGNKRLTCRLCGSSFKMALDIEECCVCEISYHIYKPKS